MGELEDAVMTRVWKWNRPVTVREVLEDLQQERSIAYTTVMTVMDNLYQKGWVRREAEGRAYRYAAVSTRAAYAAALMNEAWQRSDNQAAALVAFFGMMSPEQRDALGDAMRVIQLPAEEPREVPAPPEGAEGAEESEGAEEAGEAAEAGEEQGSPEPAQDSGAPSAPGAAAELPESEGGAAEAGGGR
ncbi:BlaI/MecI/CopY family transcriptional regulator [Streptomyces albidoflavus]|uniref:BlaI/MecI/CopY family transcriptional regulator n=1 Tax=unclassified Streptomyces TaxID=2593676 RepID=UPI0020D11C9A|nr:MULTISPECIES: BlaI/MecI/CopY family transcriptional regulator [Streptomyces]MCX4465972.1 BlaI/MecI/CopY family transcriptional regulator [Streptomyces albidoflavus]MCX5460255.1 BlaI/MecI/CopY family transcriptional regulator [Streptomyces sp. FT1]WAC96882.1 BlaI/MecI/CopY family transcriptional regulator [Streptomyces sp. NA13]WJK69756.1 BlaI/MecI/CopY family transcriptional regulator [Streptomyces albidoflavus]WSB14956.1 BlaI/MecI/CopY family transcriptional regulator [Streptomyces albidof